MGTLVTRKGQVTIPKKVRDYLGITPGTAVEFDLGRDGEVVVHKTAGHKTGAKPRQKSGTFTRLKGLAKGGMSTDEIMALTRGER